MPYRPSPAALSGEESVEVATPTPSWVPRGKERAVGGGWGRVICVKIGDGGCSAWAASFREGGGEV